MTFTLDIAEVRRDAERALLEDLGEEDITAALLPEVLKARAYIVSREPMLVCGQAWSDAVFHRVDPTIQIDWHVQESSYLNAPKRLCTLSGTARSLLTAERAALNFLQTLSGTATTTYRYLKHLQGYPVTLLDTRKTIPGLRYAQKYAVRCAGGVNHRMGLYDAYLIKENHIKACGSLTDAISRARKKHPEKFLEVEVETLEELDEALKACPNRILLDNFTLEMMHEAVRLNTKKISLEVSGGIDENMIASIAAIGIDCISVGALTKHLHAIDLSLLIEEEP